MVAARVMAGRPRDGRLRSWWPAALVVAGCAYGSLLRLWWSAACLPVRGFTWNAASRGGRYRPPGGRHVSHETSGQIGSHDEAADEPNAGR
jgi:hypothetical protein